jgi:hypothetical protein
VDADVGLLVLGDDHGAVIGVISERDLVRAFAEVETSPQLSAVTLLTPSWLGVTPLPRSGRSLKK